MNKRTSAEIIITLLLLVLLILLVNPFNIFMTDAMTMTVIAAMLVTWAVFAGLAWKERPRDEREQYHRMLSARSAYLVGTFGLALLIAVRSFQHSLDVWLPVVLTIMVCTKLVASAYLDRRR